MQVAFIQELKDKNTPITASPLDTEILWKMHFGLYLVL